MVFLVFIVSVCWFTGKLTSPFLSLMYLILLATALTQGRRITYLMAGLAIMFAAVWLRSREPGTWRRTPVRKAVERTISPSSASIPIASAAFLTRLSTTWTN